MGDLGLTLSHTRAHLYRGLLEGVAYGVRHHLDLMAEVGVVPRRLAAGTTRLTSPISHAR